MPRKLLKKYMPDPQWVRNHRHLRWMGRHIQNPNLWHLSHRSVSLAFLVGIFCAFLPMPFQMVVAAVIAVLVGSNLPVSIGLVWISNPITMPAMLYFCYQIGLLILGSDPEAPRMAWTLESIYDNFKLIWQPLLLGSVLCGIIAGVMGFITVRIVWLIHVRRSWIKRGRARALRRKQTDNTPSD